MGLSDYHTGRTLWTTSRHPFERAVPWITCNFMQELYRLSTIPLVTPSEGKGFEALETYFELLCVHNIWGTFRRVPRGSQEGSASVADWGIPNAASSLLFIFMLNVAPCCLRVIKHLSSLHKFLQMRWILLKGWLRENVLGYTASWSLYYLSFLPWYIVWRNSSSKDENGHHLIDHPPPYPQVLLFIFAMQMKIFGIFFHHFWPLIESLDNLHFQAFSLGLLNVRVCNW